MCITVLLHGNISEYLLWEYYRLGLFLLMWNAEIGISEMIDFCHIPW